MRHQGRGNRFQQGRGRRKGQAKILQVACLLQLMKQDLHGYDLLQGLDSYQTLNSTMDPSIIYRIMRDFEQNGLVASYEGDTSKGPQRRMYRLTPPGREQLAEWMLELKKMSADIELLLNNFSRARR